MVDHIYSLPPIIPAGIHLPLQQNQASSDAAKIATAVIKRENQASSVATGKWSFRHLTKAPFDLAAGSFWSCFWLIDAISVIADISTLRGRLKQEGPSDETVKIGTVIKNTFVNMVSWVSSSANLIFWAHEAKVFVLARGAVAFCCIGYGANAIVNAIESVELVKNIAEDKKKIETEPSPLVREEVKQHFCYSLMKLIGSVSMVSFGVFGVVGAAFGVIIPSAIALPIACFGGIFSIGAFFYRRHLENIGAISKKGAWA